jgi:bifunctional UDP-N-acetylglucosamine pyrophosphorylase/glucosamine-1-phosphate N-acetyltransferase
MNCNTAVILAAGAGTRMKSSTPKVLHKICGKTMIGHVLSQVQQAGVENIILVVGHGASEVINACAEYGVQIVYQTELLGTGHAVMQAQDYLPDQGDVLILCGDTPLITEATLTKLINIHAVERNSATVLTAELEDPYGYGRILRNEFDQVTRIIEQKDASEEDKTIREINSGLFCFNSKLLKENLLKLKTDNAQNEYYITDVLSLAAGEGKKTGAYKINDINEIMGINNRVQLAEAEKVMRGRILKDHMLNGVTVIDPDHTYVDGSVQIGVDTILHPGVILSGNTVIGENCSIGQNSKIDNSTIGDEVSIQSSVIMSSIIGDKSTVGPFAYLRPGSKLGRCVKIGDFVEVKNATMGDHSKASHLSYIGDADVGSHVNIGCGVVFVNYDGKRKFRSVVLDGAFIGSNSNLIAPVTVAENAYVAAGTTVSRDVPKGALCLGRVKEKHIEGWVERKKLLTELKED